MYHAADVCWVPKDGDEDGVFVDEDDLDVSMERLAEDAAAPTPAPTPPAAAAAAAAAAVPQSSRSSLGDMFATAFGGEREAAPRAQAAAAAAAAPVRRNHRRRRRRGGQRVQTQVDTNVLSIKLGDLALECAVATGEPIMCKCCRGYLSVVSRVLGHNGKVIRAGGPFTAPTGPEAVPAAATADEAKHEEAPATEAATTTTTTTPTTTTTTTTPTPLEEGEMEWVCEFCGTRNVFECDEEELPTDESTDYVLEGAPAAAVKGTPAAGGDGDDGIIVFAVDVSGSMSVTTEVAGRVALKGDRSQELRRLHGAHGAAGNQYWPGQRRDVTYVSRLQSVMAAVTAQIEQVRRDHPNKRVALVSFSNEVVIHGDGSKAPTHLAGTRLDNFDQLSEAAAGYRLEGKIKDTAKRLTETVHGLEEGGATALGPALLVSVMMASRGSRVVMCTDGLANVGLGAVDGDGEAAANAAEEFYRRIGLLAVERGVVVDVVGIEGEGCDVETLTLAVEPSGGTITKVQPTDVTRNFAAMLANKPVATKVSATMFLHKMMKFREQLDDDVSLGGYRLMRHLGNVVKDSQTTFKYSAMTSAEQRAAGITTTPSHLPFQVQIHFTRINGMKCVRVISQSKAVTRNRERAERRASVGILASHAAQQVARLARRGSYKSSLVNMRGYQHLLNRCAQATHRTEDVAAAQAYGQAMSSLDTGLRTELFNEEADASDGDAVATASSSSSSFLSLAPESRAKKAKRSRRRKKNDRLANAIFSNLRSTSSSMAAKQARPLPPAAAAGAPPSSSRVPLPAAAAAPAPRRARKKARFLARRSRSAAAAPPAQQQQAAPVRRGFLASLASSFRS